MGHRCSLPQRVWPSLTPGEDKPQRFCPKKVHDLKERPHVKLHGPRHLLLSLATHVTEDKRERQPRQEKRESMQDTSCASYPSTQARALHILMLNLTAAISVVPPRCRGQRNLTSCIRSVHSFKISLTISVAPSPGISTRSTGSALRRETNCTHHSSSISHQSLTPIDAHANIKASIKASSSSAYHQSSSECLALVLAARRQFLPDPIRIQIRVYFNTIYTTGSTRHFRGTSNNTDPIFLNSILQESRLNIMWNRSGLWKGLVQTSRFNAVVCTIYSTSNCNDIPLCPTILGLSIPPIKEL